MFAVPDTPHNQSSDRASVIVCVRSITYATKRERLLLINTAGARALRSVYFQLPLTSFGLRAGAAAILHAFIP